MTNIQTAGYIVTSNEAIWGYGPTADAAWASFEHGLQQAGIRIVDDPTDADIDNGGDWTRQSDYTIRPASAALLAAVDDLGKAISWGSRNGVCCTRGEADGE